MSAHSRVDNRNKSAWRASLSLAQISVGTGSCVSGAGSKSVQAGQSPASARMDQIFAALRLDSMRLLAIVFSSISILSERRASVRHRHPPDRAEIALPAPARLGVRHVSAAPPIRGFPRLLCDPVKFFRRRVLRKVAFKHERDASGTGTSGLTDRRGAAALAASGAASAEPCLAAAAEHVLILEPNILSDLQHC